ncbi:helix-turn-helix domain-containing protein [Streptomyces sp. DSM 42041]|uniref:Helix-turn-helix domain-containing protein n=1 Tax=Streptomyces hazeniae TaxID=3075538 RepID=A0ABU2NYQ3_9ACTN|nr:helix-turn-helix domain-containing protein [Streptomyces sp. DSM 42041]MDT0382122.1 helix-turn-helix domain-containing protein [Streptomyces sp. DSM 42041]
MQARGKVLPGNGRCKDLARELRALRGRSGLTLAALAERTCYSKSSWERYLNGKSVPPEAAVRAFASAVGVPPGRLLVLHGLAETHEEGTGVPAKPEPEASGPPVAGGPPVPAGPGPDATGRPRRRLAVPALCILLGLLMGVATGIGVALLPGDGGAAAGPGASSLAAEDATNQAPGCVGFACNGRDAERFGCHLEVWTAAVRKVGARYVELRYSPVCQAAWARVSYADVGDAAVVEGPEDHSARRTIVYGHDVYSPMVDAPFPASARACVTLAEGRTVCTPRGGASPAPAASPHETRS